MIGYIDPRKHNCPIAKRVLQINFAVFSLLAERYTLMKRVAWCVYSYRKFHFFHNLCLLNETPNYDLNKMYIKILIFDFPQLRVRLGHARP